MSEDVRAAGAILAIVVLVFLGASLFVNVPAVLNGFLFADQAVYFSMAQSIVFDGDLEFSKKDLARYYPEFNAGPQGIFLKKARDGRLLFAKSFVYPLFAAPFVRVLGTNGFFVFHSLLLLLILLMGFHYFSLSDKPLTALLLVLTFLFASVAGVYFVWMTPEFLNLGLVFAILFLWLYKTKAGENARRASRTGKPGRGEAFLLSDKSDLLAAFLAGIAVFSKPPNAALIGVILISQLLRGKVRKAGSMLLCFVLSIAVLAGVRSLLASDWSDWNYQGGERKTFYLAFPFGDKGLTFDTVGKTMTSENYFERFLLPPKFMAYNLFYYVFGRFTGLAWYFFPALLFLFLFVRGRRNLSQWLILAALAAEILSYLLLMPTNFGGGGGSLANRYFMSIYPLFLFLFDRRIKTRELVLAWVMAGIFISQILVNPIRASAFPATHVKRFPIKALPLEMTLIDEWPTNTGEGAFHVPIGTPPNLGYLYFVDDNSDRKGESGGFWTTWDRECEMVLKTGRPLKEIVVGLLNNPRPGNEIQVKVGGLSQKIMLGPKGRGTLRFSVGDGFWWRKLGKDKFIYFPAGKGWWWKLPKEETHLYRIRIKAGKGSIPHFEDEDSRDCRELGVFFELELVPRTSS
jgi:hypothetical protein